MRIDLENLEQGDAITVFAGLECDLNDLDYRLTGRLGEEGLPAHALAKIADILRKRALAADALARLKDRFMSGEI